VEQSDDQLGFVILDESEQAVSGDSSSPSSNQRAEMLLGLLLLLIVIGWSLWVWRQQQQLDAYNSGKHYAAAQDWDQALASYRAAGDYADSAVLTRQVMAVVDERDRLYSAGTEALAASAWVVALQDLRELRDIEPGYRDSSTLYRAAENNTYSVALTGVVALRVDAGPAGLYLWNDRGWIWLPGSDAASSLRGYGPGGCLVYDVPVGNSNLDNTAANPDLFTTSVLSLDLTPAARGLMDARITGAHSGGASATIDAVLDTAAAGTEQTGKLYCRGELARKASAPNSSHLGAGILAYIGNGALRARSDDGQVDLLLERGVQRLFDTVP
jgi:hypothetical protein